MDNDNRNSSQNQKRGFTGSMFLFFLAIVLVFMVVQNWNADKKAAVSFSYQLENLVNLDLINPEDSAKVAIKDNLVSFSGKFREEKTEIGKQRFAFLTMLNNNHSLLSKKDQILSSVTEQQTQIHNAADWFLHVSGQPIPKGGYVVVDANQDVNGLSSSVIITSLTKRNVMGIPTVKTQLGRLGDTPSDQSVASLGENVLSVIGNFKSPNLGIGSQAIQENLAAIEKEAKTAYNSQLSAADKVAVYTAVISKLEATALLLNANVGGFRLSQLRAVRLYKQDLGALKEVETNLTTSREQLQKAQLAIGNTVWFFNNKEVTTNALMQQDPEAFSNWYNNAKKEWNEFDANKGLAFRAPDQPLNLVLENRFKSQQPAPNYVGYLITLLPVFVVLGLLYFVFSKQMKGVGSGAMNFGKSPAKLLNKETNKVTFKDVAGIDEASEELQEIVEFLKDPGKYTALGAQIPKGVLCIGPPGTGKTLIAKAVAGEADCPFYSISGSDFVEMFVGVGASRIRDLFEQAKKSAPCIIFIDEIDAVGRHRGAGMGGGHDEREQTLNQLLVEMDGFDTNEGVIIMAATNRPDVLDRALLRPGRFDRRINVDLPDVKGRFEILKVHARKIKIDPSVDLMSIAKGTPGSSGADLKNILNESALISARKGRTAVTADDAMAACDKVRFGKERKSLEIDEQDRKTTAYHEAGHAIVGLVVDHGDPVEKVTIIPRGMSLGATHFLPEKNKHNYWKKQLIDQLAICMGGRVAEEIFVGDVSSGAQQDIQQATNIARSMVCRWGMSELGSIAYEEPAEKMGQMGYFGNSEKPYSEETAKLIDKEVKVYVDAANQRARDIIEENRAKVELMTERLMQFETLYKEDLDQIMEKGELSAEEIQQRIESQEQKFRRSPPPPPADFDAKPDVPPEAPEAPPAGA